MEERQIIDTIIESTQQKIQDDVGGLLGTTFTLSPAQSENISGIEFFNRLSGSQVLTRIEITGDRTGNGWLIVGIREAIRLGGTLIMLPPPELDDLVENEAYDEETEESYGEIGNIIAATYTKVISDMGDSSYRFDRKEQKLINPPFSDTTDDLQIADTLFYKVTAGIKLEESQIGELNLLLPAALFGLVEDEQDSKTDQDSETGGDENKTEIVEKEVESEQSSTEIADESAKTDSSGSDTLESPAESTADDFSESGADATRRDIDSLLEICRVRLQEEIGDVVGVEVSCSEMRNIVVTKEQFYLDQTKGKQVTANIEVNGDVDDCCYLSLGIKDAIRFGCTLLMLPSIELEEAVSENNFNPDIKDAYKEIVNVVSRVYTEVFDAEYRKTFKFTHSTIDVVAPMKVDFDSDEPIVNRNYYLNRLNLSLGGKSSGHLQMLFPSEILDLVDLQPEELQTINDNRSGVDQVSTPAEANMEAAVPDSQEDEESDSKDSSGEILIISDEDQEASRINDILDSKGISVVQLNFRDNVSDYLPGSFKAVLLVMDEVNEQSLGKAIKINTICSLPLIATGAEWTRSKVFKAVKYGINDILLAPVSESDINRKITSHITSLAA